MFATSPPPAPRHAFETLTPDGVMDALASVGSYQLEGLGIHLFERIEGDYFTILGLPLLFLLRELRAKGLVAL